MQKKQFLMRCLVSVYLILMFILFKLYAQDYKIKTIKWNEKDTEVAEGEILLTLTDLSKKVQFISTMNSFGFEILNKPDKNGVARLRIPDKVNFFEAIEKLKKINILKNIEPNFIDHISNEPNDEYYENQWAHSKIHSESAWDIETGSSSVLVAVLDSGIPIASGSLSHEDLDNSSRITLGYDYANSDSEPGDDCGHGTHVTGILSAETDNNDGIAGMSWYTKLYIVKVFDEEGSGTHLNFYNGVVEAVDGGAKIINYSGGGVAGNYKLQAVIYADNHDCLIVASAGNGEGGPVEYPAAYSSSYNNVIAVSATNSSDVIADFSSVGPQINIAAPGVSIYSTMPDYHVALNDSGYDQDYDYMSGTSMAAPHVAGLAALILSKNSSLEPSDIRETIELSAKDLGTTGFDNSYGHGRIVANAAVRNLYVPQVYSTIASANSVATSGQKIVVNSGTHYIYNDITISSGVTLEILPGATIWSDEGVRFTVNGTITAEGTSNDRITFTGPETEDEEEAWGDLSVYGSNYKFEYCDFEYAEDGLLLYAPSQNDISNCNFTNNFERGILISGVTQGKVRVYNCNITDNDYKGIYVTNNTADDCIAIECCLIEDNYTGIYSYNNDVSVWGCCIRYNNDGIYSRADDVFHLNLWGTDYGGNSINNNNSDGIYIYSFDGDYIDLEGTGGEDNANYDNDDYEVYNNSSDWAYAEDTYWGSGASWYGNVDHSDPLGYDPTVCCSGIKKSLGNVSMGDLPESELQRNLKENPAVVIPEEELKEIIEKNPDSKEALLALARLRIQIRKTYDTNPNSINELISYLETLYSTRKSSAVGKKALYYLTKERTHQKQFEDAITLCQQGLDLLEDIDREMVLERLVWLYLNVKKFDLAEQALEDFKDEYGAKEGNSYAVRFLERRLLRESSSDYGSRPLEKEASEISTSEETVLLQIYPNPSNPFTTIRFRLPDANRVVLKIINILGQEVKTLVDEVKEAGVYTLVWDGKNSSGLEVPSGTYLYTLRAGEKVITRKLLLMK